MIAGAARAGSDSNPNHLGPITWTLAFTLGVLTLILAGCSSQNYTPASLPATSYHYAPSVQSYGTSRTEVASWYGPGFAGRRTSSGETYNPEGLTAASKTLPLGSHVRVTNPDTGRSVVVRINDRGPFVRGRSLDLSHGAAQRNRADRQGSRQGAGDAYRDQHAGPEFRHVDVCRKLRHHHVTPCELRLVLAADTRRSQTPSLSLRFVAPKCLKSHRRLALQRTPAILKRRPIRFAIEPVAMDLITQFRTMAQYNTLMNRSIYDTCGALSDVERKRDVHAFFGSIHRTLDHLLLTDRVQMGRFVGADRMRSLDDSGREIEIRSLDQELYADFATLRREREKTDSCDRSMDSIKRNHGRIPCARDVV